MTRADLQQHRAELVSLRICLFGSRDPADFYVTEIQEIGPRVLVMRNLDTNTLNRELHRGGLEFELSLPEMKAARRVGVEHWSGDLYWLYARVQSPNNLNASYTRFSLTVPFAKLADAFLRRIEVMASECRASIRAELA